MSLDYLNECVRNNTKLQESKFFHSSVYYIKALLEDRFFPRKFTLNEVKGLIEEIYPQIPNWYKEKYGI